ncbi:MULTISPECIES: nuclear transport factor 2 family protein [unclassified Mycolicibacterium]|uniref:nuclear transport factor 2 family protein n=1 Tax=unclassified Mycolicibacterium TaxID=2636767 RepID=UPI0012DDC831|nr:MULTISPECIES: nuclear transport factor 2 family protein [unclassified Mycolicibacterium]MUL80891.1 nuclear transport factor 2 family protein [Mycolicibacterium sp. CBMA 329]MUL86657.1 nuclear transport factor 2 family protein [Mycolicibacterium sp. CBMA 331]MUM02860.1 nuclear transport factor 2 family protein [Mycolicibacterium sp. CBMA 334]MUM27647.1 nuclear transport factor 2 family protein [Mycolicibacterium sp. CBMA 295]MUM36954.1 nuclear transport factor 2 family protein [Mycolicibacte
MSPADVGVVEDVADRLFAAIERGDRTAVAQLWADDVTVWHAGDAKDNDRARALRVIDWFIGATPERHYDVLDRQFFDGGFVQQHVLQATGRDGAAIALRVCIVIKVGSRGLIHRIDEYFDPKDIAPLFT